MAIKDVNLLCMGCFGEIDGGARFCTVCGYDLTEQTAQPHHLRPRTILNGKYLLGKVLGQGGFGITYIGWDLNLDVKVAIKEYYPSGFVTRETTSTSTVQPFTGSQGDFFVKGREHFINEAKNLAKFYALPGIVSVKDYFQENGTAYIAMEYIEGRTLKTYLEEMGGALPAAQVFDMMKPIMTSLAQVHKSGLIHRDISPDNIMISKEGYMKLLDFGAAREFADSGNKSMSIMLKPGFAPEEQYRTKGRQGPWTDVYALSATMYRAITGVTPDEALDRIRMDDVKRPSMLGIPIHPSQEAALMKGMGVMQENRWQSMWELSAALYGPQAEAPATTPAHASKPNPATHMPPSAPVSAAPSHMHTPAPVPASATKKPNKIILWTVTAILGGIAAMTILVVLVLGSLGDTDTPSGYTIDSATPTPALSLPTPTASPDVAKNVMAMYDGSSVPDIGAFLGIDYVDYTATYRNSQVTYCYDVEDVSQDDLSSYIDMLFANGFDHLSEEVMNLLNENITWVEGADVYVGIGSSSNFRVEPEVEYLEIWIIKWEVIEYIRLEADPELKEQHIIDSITTRFDEERFERIALNTPFDMENELRVEVTDVASYYANGAKCVAVKLKVNCLVGGDQLYMSSSELLLFTSDPNGETSFVHPSIRNWDGEDLELPIPLGEDTLYLTLFYIVPAESSQYMFICTNMMNLQEVGPLHLYLYYDENLLSD